VDLKSLGIGSGLRCANTSAERDDGRPTFDKFFFYEGNSISISKVSVLNVLENRATGLTLRLALVMMLLIATFQLSS